MSLYKIFPLFYFYFFINLRGKDRERQGHWSVASCMHPNRESNMPPDVRNEAPTVQGFPHF